MFWILLLIYFQKCLADSTIWDKNEPFILTEEAGNFNVTFEGNTIKIPESCPENVPVLILNYTDRKFFIRLRKSDSILMLIINYLRTVC